MDRYEDVTVPRRRQPVDDGRRHAPIEDEHRPLAGAHGQVRAGQGGDLPGPRTRGRYDRAAGDRARTVRADVAHANRRHGVLGGAFKADDLVVAQRIGTMLPRRCQVGLDQLPRLERRVGHAIRGADLARQERLGGEQGIERDRLGLDARSGAGGREAIDVVVRIVGSRHEVAAGRLDGGRRDAPQHRVLLHAVPRRDRVRFNVASAGVEQPVIPAARAGREVPALDEQRAQAPHGQVAEDAGARGAAADDDDVDLGARVHPGVPRRSGSAPRR